MASAHGRQGRLGLPRSQGLLAGSQPGARASVRHGRDHVGESDGGSDRVRDWGRVDMVEAREPGSA